MDEISERFRQFMDERRLKTPEVAAVFHVAEQTIHHWRSGGIPPRRQAQVAEWMAARARNEFGDPIDTLRMRTLVVEASRNELVAWQRSALAAGKILDDWARDGLNAMAIAQGYGDLIDIPPDPTGSPSPFNPLQSLPKVAEPVDEYKSKHSRDAQEDKLEGN